MTASESLAGSGSDGEPFAVRAGAARDRGSAGHEVAERAGVGGGGDRVAGCVAVEDLELRDRRVAPRVGTGGDESADGGREDAVRDRIDGEREDAGASVDAGAGDDSIVAPRDVLDGAGDGDEDVLRRGAETDAADFAGEDGLDAGGGDALAGGDDAGVGNGARRGLRGGLEEGDDEKNGRHIGWASRLACAGGRERTEFNVSGARGDRTSLPWRGPPFDEPVTGGLAALAEMILKAGFRCDQPTKRVCAIRVH